MAFPRCVEVRALKGWLSTFSLFGEPVDVSSYFDVHRVEPAKALRMLTTAIHWAMEREVVHVEHIDTNDGAHSFRRSAVSRRPRA